MITPPHTQVLKDADAKAADGDYLRAIALYEAALNDTARAADIHYKLALLYDDKLNDPLDALHHFRRYLALNPSGPRSIDIKNYVKRDEIALVTSLSGDSVVTPVEAARLRNENLSLREQLEGRLAKSRPTPDKNLKHDGRAHSDSSPPDGASESTGNAPRTYVVKPGDTLYSIARKFYKSPARWKEIRDANRGKTDKAGELKPGAHLVIP